MGKSDCSSTEAKTVLPQMYHSMSPVERRHLREAYADHQGGLCWHCHEPLSGPPRKDIARKQLNMRLFPANFLKWPRHLHHSHLTGLTIGTVHAKCNGVLFQYHGE